LPKNKCEEKKYIITEIRMLLLNYRKERH